MKKCAVIINPTSGKGVALKKIKQIRAVLDEYDYTYHMYITEYVGHAKEIVTNLEKVDLVISIGGDGTFNEVMQGNFLRKRKLLLTHIPFGTANDVGAMYGYTKSIIKNLRMALEGEVKKIDICTINDIPFTYVAAFGKLTNVSYETPKKLKKRFGYLAYLIMGLREINHKTKLHNIKYTIDKETIIDKYSFVLISNANRIGGINNFYDDIYLDDNRFEVLFCNLTTKKDIIKAILHLAKRDITKVPGFNFYKTNKLTIEFDTLPNKGWSVDGEELLDKNLKYEIKIVRNIKVLLPAKRLEQLFLEKENDRT